MDQPTTMTRLESWGDIDGIVLDAVGTLINPVPSVASAYAATAARQGIFIEEAEVKRRFGLHFRNDEVDEQLGPMATDEAIEYRRWRRIVANVLPDLPDLDRGFDELWDHFGRPEAWRCFPDVGPGLRTLHKAGIPIRVTSNFDGRLRAVAASLPELARFVDTLVISSEVGYRKPHPAIYAAACTASTCLPVVSSASATIPRTTSTEPNGPAFAGHSSIERIASREGSRRSPTCSLWPGP